MEEAGVVGEDGRLAAALAAALEPDLQDALNHPTRRDILRVLQEAERPCSVREIHQALPPLSRGEVVYHLRVLVDAGSLEGEPHLLLGRRDPRYRSRFADDDQARLVLAATQEADMGQRQKTTETSSSGFLTMFRLPRSRRVIRLIRFPDRDGEAS